ncbi:hypothetical protein KAU43_03720 [candidate division WOR-3 bacterium]|nr:hypothetical protein [candidate division WOR-3 bacterium]
MMKWLLITKQKRLKHTILKEYKRHPHEFEVIEDFKECTDPLQYERIIIGDDIWKRYRTIGKRWKFRNEFMDFYYEKLVRNSLKNSLQVNIVTQCDKCKKKGTRLNKADGVCKPCRTEMGINLNAKIVEEDEDWIARMNEIEPQKVEIINKKIPAKLGRITQEIIDKYFPEFRGINIRFTSTASGRSLYCWNIALNPEILEDEISYTHTIAHELTHQMCQLQGVLRGRSEEVAYLYDQQIPHGELQTEMWTFARHPDLVCHSYFFKLQNKEEKELLERLWEEEDKEKYQEIYFSTNKEHFQKHKQQIHELSKQALLKRKEGMVKYLAWYREELRKIGIIGYGRSY